MQQGHAARRWRARPVAGLRRRRGSRASRRSRRRRRRSARDRPRSGAGRFRPRAADNARRRGRRGRRRRAAWALAYGPVATFDLIVATVDRVDELDRLLGSLERQTHGDFRVLVVDQNEDDRLERVLRGHSELDVVRLRSGRGLSRARNAALPGVQADLVAFPDDDCVYPDDLLERVADRFDATPTLAGLTGREVDEQAHSSPSWARDAAVLTRENLWNRAISFTIFLRAAVVANVGPFDERLGLGA